MPWNPVSRRRAQLPKDWHRRVAATKRRAGGRCEHIDDDGRRCPRPGTECDHRTDPLNHNDLQWLCYPHHREKTEREAAEARRAVLAKLHPPTHPHPGLRG